MLNRSVTGAAIILTAALLACSLAPSAPVPSATPAPSGLSKFQPVIIPTGLDVRQPYQSLPYFLRTGDGHYLLYLLEAQRLIYDGREIYSGPLAQYHGPAIALSHNGLHHAYILDSSEAAGFNDLYVDGLKVVTAKDMANPAVTDDGGHYFYTACNNANGMSGTCLFKDGKDILLHNDGIMELWVSADGATYYAWLRGSSGDSQELLVRNGEELYRGALVDEQAVSPNGAHFAYDLSDSEAGTQSLVVDGQVKFSTSALLGIQVTDLGSYCAWDSARSQVVVNDRTIPVTHEQILCFMNADASHVLVRDGDWFLDGQPVQLPGVTPEGRVADVEMAGDVWYVYVLVR